LNDSGRDIIQPFVEFTCLYPILFASAVLSATDASSKSSRSLPQPRHFFFFVIFVIVVDFLIHRLFCAPFRQWALGVPGTSPYSAHRGCFYRAIDPLDLLCKTGWHSYSQHRLGLKQFEKA
jgi:hypothetical protein